MAGHAPVPHRRTLSAFLPPFPPSRFTRKGGNGARVIQWGGGARQLYYYPKNTIQVTNVGESVNKSLIEQAGIQAAVPTLGRKQPVWDLSFAADGSVRGVRAAQRWEAPGLMDWWIDHWQTEEGYLV